MKFSFLFSGLLFGFAAAQNAVEVAVGAPDLFSTLVDLVVIAGLDEALSTAQDITVFAPTNGAFGKLHEGSLNLLKSEQWRPHLQNLLSYHVLPVKIFSSAITDGLTAATLTGEEVKLNLPASGGVLVNGHSNVVQADGIADNAAIHAVDSVLFPEWVYNSIVNRAISDPELSTLTKLISGLHLTGALSQHGPFTVFAPTDDAFLEGLNALGASDGKLDAGLASKILTYHVVHGIYSAADITDGLELTTANGETIRFSVNEGAPQVNGENIIGADILANNGIVHKIDGLLIPESVAPAPEAPEEPQTVVDIAVSNSDTFSTLVDFAVAAGLVDALSTTQGITVFAPTNDAFATLASAAPEVVANLQTSLWQPHLKNVLLYHVLSSEVPSSAVTNGLTATALNGEDLAFTVNGDEIFVNTNSQVILADVEADNGVIHAIDNVLIPSWVGNSIADLAIATPALSTLVDLVVQAGLVDTLSGPGPFTVFAPVNAAFVEFLGGVADPASLDQDLVSAILTYHVVPGIVAASDIVNGATLTTVQGEELTFTLMGDAAMVNGETIVSTDILANNGIVHVIGGVLLPSAATASVVLQESLAEPPAQKTLSLMGSEQESSGHRATAAFASALVSFGALMGMVF